MDSGKTPEHSAESAPNESNPEYCHPQQQSSVLRRARLVGRKTGESAKSSRTYSSIRHPLAATAKDVSSIATGTKNLAKTTICSGQARSKANDTG
jgi:hypothetical protein